MNRRRLWTEAETVLNLQGNSRQMGACTQRWGNPGCGVWIGQSGDISEIFKASGLSEVGIIKDYNNVDRIVKGVYYYNA